MSPTDVPAPGERPVFVLFAARSGSTLLRLLLDTHPEIASPPEPHLAQVCESLHRTWQVVSTDGTTAELPEAKLREIGDLAAEPLRWYAHTHGKQRWCDKSLENLRLAPLLSRAYPHARFVVLVRHCLDLVMSGLDASRWGFTGYGFEGYVRSTPGNTVQALIRYWCDYAESLLRVLDEFGDRATLVRYEDLVAHPAETMTRVFDFLEVPAVPDIATRAFDTAHDLVGPGDHKVAFTDAVQTSSVGTGKQVPVRLIDDGLLARMNASLAAAGYPPVDHEWNETVPARGPGDGRAAARAVWGFDQEPVPCPHDAADRAEVVLEDLGVRWQVDLHAGKVYACDRGCPARGRLITDAATLRGIVNGEVNVGGALRTGTMRARGGTSLVGTVVEILRSRVP